MSHTLIYDQIFTKIIKFPLASALLCSLDWTPWHFEIFMVPSGWILSDSDDLLTIKHLKCGFLSHAATLHNQRLCCFILTHMLLMSDMKDTFFGFTYLHSFGLGFFFLKYNRFWSGVVIVHRDHMRTCLPFGHNLQSKDNWIPLAFVADIDRDRCSEGCSVSQHEWLFCNPLLSSGQSWFP